MKTIILFIFMELCLTLSAKANIWVLNDIEGAKGKGHMAIIIGGEKLGYYLITQTPVYGTTAKEFWLGLKPESIYVLADTSIPKLIEHIHSIDTIQIYDQAMLFQTEDETDLRVIEYISHRLLKKKHYSVIFNNCGEFVQDVLDVADIDNGWSIYPNTLFENLKEIYPEHRILNVKSDLLLYPESYEGEVQESIELWHD